MTYLTQESSKSSGKPVFLYEFVQGVITWRFTTYATDYIWNGQTWLPTSASHSDVKQSNELSKDSVSFKFSRTDSFASEFLGYSPDQVVSVTIRRGHANDGEFVVYWKGRVVGSKASDNNIDVECESIFTSLRRPGLRARYQRSCRHALYTTGCNLSKSSFLTAGTVSAIAGSTITVPAAGSAAAGWWVGGIVDYNSHMRMVMAHSGPVLTLSRPIESLTNDFQISGAGVLVVNLHPGCDRSRATCESKFANQLNFGGFPWIPTKNPMGGSSIV